MENPVSKIDLDATMDQVLGYVNFASGNHDSVFFVNLNRLFYHFISLGAADQSEASAQRKNSGRSLAASKTQQPTELIRVALTQRLAELKQTKDTFRDCKQSEAVLSLTFEKLLPAYRKHHRDLLFHQTDEFLFNSFFIGRAFEAVLQQGPPWSREQEIIGATLGRLNNFIGHRPVATLESQKIEPYDHEWIRPVPVYIKGAGTAAGPYFEIITQALAILQQTDPQILKEAQFDPEKLDELAIDPRAFDFDHPINKRPNHHFGQWDEHQIDGSGFYRRFIIHQVTLDSLLSRVEDEMAGSSIGDSAENAQQTRDELVWEASAVLAGTMLMASGVSGAGPGAFDSNTTLSHLLPVIAGYRDRFYSDLMQRLEEPHRSRLHSESLKRQQAFGAVRQDLNARLSQRRASQLVNCRLASIYARMGYPEAATKQSKVVPVAAARITCQIDCLLNEAARAISKGELDDAFQAIPAAMRRLHRGIHCGAIVDPWNILGFDANYSLFPAIENSIRDHRVFDLVDLMERIFAICSRLWSEAAASDRTEMCAAIRNEFFAIVTWWRQFAAHEVMSVEAVDADEIFQAAELVAEALNLWHKGGAAAGDISFWAEHAELFDSPKAYALVIDALMQRDDYTTSTALLVNWLSQADEIPLQLGDSSFHQLVFQWIFEQKNLLRIPVDVGEAPNAANTGSISTNDPATSAGTQPNPAPNSPQEIWGRIRKFYDFIEANAEHYWNVPTFHFDQRIVSQQEVDPGFDELDELMDDEYSEESENDDLFRAAYDDVTYSDTTDDGFEGEVFDGSLTSDDALEAEVDRVLDRLEFLSTVACYWGIAATVPFPVTRKSELTDDLRKRLTKRREIIHHWVRQAIINRQNLTKLLETLNRFPLPKGGSDHDSMLHYDQHRLYKDTLLDQAIHTCIETESAVRMLVAVGRSIDYLLDDRPLTRHKSGNDATPQLQTSEEKVRQEFEGDDYDRIAVNGSEPLVSMFSAILLQDAKLVNEHVDLLTAHLKDQSLLYIPVSKGGDPEAIVKARVLQIAILDLLRNLPSLGLLTATFELTQTGLAMERNNPIGQGAVTEFDELFEVAFTSMVHALVESTDQFQQQQQELGERKPKEIRQDAERIMFECIEKLTQSMLVIWLDHSQTLRLSVMEKVKDRDSWERLVEFVEKYGTNLFTQHFLHLGNLRAILHQGVEHWLEQLLESNNPPDLRLLDELGTGIARPKAVRYLTLVLEAVVENYNEYRDYNTTTTQSDHGEQLYKFLDFLRLRGRYDRVCWNLKPVIWAHSILVNDQKNNVARRWRRALIERVGGEADKYLKQLEKLRNKYSMRMESIGRRLEGRFANQLQIDRLVALVAPAMEDPESAESNRVFELLQHEAQTFTKSTIGVGIDLPAWLAALENEVDQYQLAQQFLEPAMNQPLPLTDVIPIASLQEQLEELPGRPLFE